MDKGDLSKSPVPDNYKAIYERLLDPGRLRGTTDKIELSVSEPYALRIRGGACIPHPRHWQKLAALANLN
jgi:hypothetical protein